MVVDINGCSPLRFPGGLGVATVATAQLPEKNIFLLPFVSLGIVQNLIHFVLNARFVPWGEKKKIGTILN